MSGFSRRDLIRTGAAGAAAFAAGAKASPLDSARMLPAQLDKSAFAAAVGELRAVVGAEWVFADADSTLPYLKSFTPDPRHEHVPSGAVAPASVEEVQAIVRLANEHKTPLWPVARGKNLGYGTAAPRMAGSVVLDLGRMNRILELDPTLAYCVVEPGVGFFDLYEAIQRDKLPLWLSVPGNAWGSVMGNTLEHGIGYTPYGLHARNVCDSSAMDGTRNRMFWPGFTICSAMFCFFSVLPVPPSLLCFPPSSSCKPLVSFARASLFFLLGPFFVCFPFCSAFSCCWRFSSWSRAIFSALACKAACCCESSTSIWPFFSRRCCFCFCLPACLACFSLTSPALSS